MGFEAMQKTQALTHRWIRLATLSFAPASGARALPLSRSVPPAPVVTSLVMSTISPVLVPVSGAVPVSAVFRTPTATLAAGLRIMSIVSTPLTRMI